LESLARWDGQPNAFSFFLLSNRTRRAIAASPGLLLEQRLRNVTPFLDRDFMTLAMAITPHHKLSGDSIVSCYGPPVLRYKSFFLETIRNDLPIILATAVPSWPPPRFQVIEKRFIERLVSWLT
jgi:hypothetical protein